jgi:hypothetical protein
VRRRVVSEEEKEEKEEEEEEEEEEGLGARGRLYGIDAARLRDEERPRVGV